MQPSARISNVCCQLCAVLKVHCTEVVGIPRNLRPEIAVLARAQYFCETLGVLPSLTSPHKSMFVSCEFVFCVFVFIENREVVFVGHTWSLDLI